MKKKTVGCIIWLEDIRAPVSKFDKDRLYSDNKTVLLISDYRQAERMIQEDIKTRGENRQSDYPIYRVVTENQ